MHENDAEFMDALDEVVGIWGAQSPPDLWDELLLHAAGRSSSSCWDADSVFRRLHGEGQDGALASALLLLTDWRWYRCTATSSSRSWTRASSPMRSSTRWPTRC